MDLQSPSVFKGNVYWAGHSPATLGGHRLPAAHGMAPLCMADLGAAGSADRLRQKIPGNVRWCVAVADGAAMWTLCARHMITGREGGALPVQFLGSPRPHLPPVRDTSTLYSPTFSSTVRAALADSPVPSYPRPKTPPCEPQGHATRTAGA
jgi:hypothetical protein